MTNCEKCGKLIEAGAVFCESCKPYKSRSVPPTLSEEKIVSSFEHEIFSYKPKHSSLWVKFARFFPFIISIVFIIIGIYSFLDTSGQILVLNEIYLSLFIITGIFILLYSKKRYKIDYNVIISLCILVVVLGGIVLFPEYAILLFSLGFILIGIFSLFPVVITKKRSIFFVLTILSVIIILSLVITFPSQVNIIFPIGAIAVGFEILILRFYS
ncbi:hypothetical protein [Candidatus Hodarchaeum mangrovi]